MNYLWMTISYATGLLAGLIIAYIYIRSRSVGCIRIDRSDPEEPPLLFLELHTSVETVSNGKYVILSVKNKNFINHDMQK